ncbi:hypothetical protein [Streptomyces sp. NPDC051561]|uniref:hypothetical protein n=1 Tax=Streptomyces sp. NPDC051561 TaxID=3365658 RepID=UPI0037B1CF2C
MPGDEFRALAPGPLGEVRSSSFREFRAEWQVLDGRVDLTGFLKDVSEAATPGIAGAAVSVKVQFSDQTTRTCTSHTRTGDGSFACEVEVAGSAEAPIPVRATASWSGSREFSATTVTKDVEAVIPDAVEDGGAV